jgi:hypothetical protein
MAIRTVVVFESTPSRPVQFEYDYDDATLIVQGVRCINNSPSAAKVTATVLESAARNAGLTRSEVFAANATRFVALPTSPNGRYQFTVEPTKGRLDGIQFAMEWPFAG